MKAQIARAISPQCWYNKRIDDIFDVIDKMENYIVKEDAETPGAFKQRLRAKEGYFK